MRKMLTEQQMVKKGARKNTNQPSLSKRVDLAKGSKILHKYSFTNRPLKPFIIIYTTPLLISRMLRKVQKKKKKLSKYFHQHLMDISNPLLEVPPYFRSIQGQFNPFISTKGGRRNILTQQKEKTCHTQYTKRSLNKTKNKFCSNDV